MWSWRRPRNAPRLPSLGAIRAGSQPAAEQQLITQIITLPSEMDLQLTITRENNSDYSVYAERENEIESSRGGTLCRNL